MTRIQHKVQHFARAQNINALRTVLGPMRGARKAPLNDGATAYAGSGRWSEA